MTTQPTRDRSFASQTLNLGFQALGLLGLMGLFLLCCYVYFPGHPTLTSLGGFVDDSFILFRYAENVSQGFGLAWNIDGPKVEGLSSIGWALILGGLRVLTGAPIPLIALHTGVACAALAIVLSWSIARQVLEPRHRAFALLAPLVLVSFPATSRHAVSGMETSFVMLAYLAYIRLVIWCDLGKPKVGLAVGLLGGAFYLIRVDALLVGLMIPAVTIVWNGFVSHRGVRPFIRATLPIASFFVAGFACSFLLIAVLRYVYFGDLIPAPAYLKLGVVTNVLSQVRFIATQWSLLFSATGLVLLPILWRQFLPDRPKAIEMAMLATIAAFAVYQLQVIPIMNFSLRYFAPMEGLISVLGAVAVARIASSAAYPRARQAAVAATFAVLVLLSGAGQFNATKAEVATSFWQTKYYPIAHALRDVDGATLMSSEAGVLPFYSKRKFIDCAGLNDAFIARSRRGYGNEFSEQFWAYVQRTYGLPDVVFEVLSDCSTFANIGNNEAIRRQFEPFGPVCGVPLFLRTTSPRYERIRQALTEIKCDATPLTGPTSATGSMSAR